MKRWTWVFCLFALLSIGSFAEDNRIQVIYSQGNMMEKQNRKLDINTATKADFLAAGFSKRYVDGILEYREEVGAFEHLTELTRIKGIGKATYQKLKKDLEIRSKKARKPLYINRADARILGYYGFTKKEIKKIMSYREKKGRIQSSREMKKILSQKKYQKYKNQFRYEN